MSEYDKELQSNTDEYEEAMEPEDDDSEDEGEEEPQS